MVSAPTRAKSITYPRSSQPAQPSNANNRYRSWNKVRHQNLWQTFGYVSGKIRFFLGTLFAPEIPQPGTHLPKTNIAKTSVQSRPIINLWPIGPLTTEQVFGPDPSKITFQQKGGLSCYLLAALDNILHHPQCNAILGKIGFEKTKDGYIVRFPGQPKPTHISLADIRPNGVQSDSLGVRLLEAAYFKIPGTQWGHVDTTNLALCRMFGEHQVVSAENVVRENDDRPLIVESFQSATQRPTQADIWTATRIVKNEKGHPIRTGAHYYSIRPAPPVVGQTQQVQIVDPFKTNAVVETLTIDQLNEKFNIEMNRLQIQRKEHSQLRFACSKLGANMQGGVRP